jgi:hypothetical protein
MEILDLQTPPDDPNRKPGVVKAVNILLLIRLFFILLVIALYALSSDSGNNQFLHKLHRVLDAVYRLSDGSEVYKVSKLIGYLLIPVVLLVLLLLSVRNRRNTAVITFAVLLLVSSLGMGGGLIELAVVILLVTGPARRYLKKSVMV